MRRLLALLLLCGICVSQKHSLNGTIYYDKDLNLYNLTINIVDCAGGIACGTFEDSLNETGWSILNIKSDFQSSYITDYNRYYAAGYLEGVLSSYEIYNYWTVAWAFGKQVIIPFEPQLIKWNTQQREWIDEQIELNKNENNNLWIYMNNTMAQFDGLVAGYNYAVSNVHKNEIQKLSSWQLSLLNGVMEYIDVIEALIANNTWYNDVFVPWRQTQRGLHCSGLIKVTPTLDNIYFAHSTWISYYWLNRVYKHYIFKSTNKEYPTTQISFSSYPGALHSMDDFYIMDSGLATMETTNSILNTTLYKYIHPQQLFTWMRARVANQLSKTGKEWISYFEQYNSGTYNNQWMILDYKLFKVNEPLNDNLLWIAEQIPGNVSSLCVTDILERGYWSSYNVPAIQFIYKQSGNQANANKSGPSVSYDLAPRARIFRRDSNQAITMQNVQKLMQYNNYLNDTIQDNNPTWAIMARADLKSANNDKPQLFGGIDTKISNLTMLQNMQCMAKSGPTNDQLPTFSWLNQQWMNEFHYALPDTYDFHWIQMQSSL